MICLGTNTWRRTGGNDDNAEKDDDADDDADAHLDILPPHLLAHAIGTTAEALGGDGQVIRLILQGIKTLASLRHLVDVVPHDTDGVVDLLFKVPELANSVHYSTSDDGKNKSAALRHYCCSVMLQRSHRDASATMI